MKTFSRILLVSGLVFVSFRAYTANSEKVKRKTKEAAGAAVEYTREQKAEIERSLEESLQSLKKQIDGMKDELNKQSASASKSAQLRMTQLEKKEADIQKKLDKMKTSSGKAWEDMKSGVNEALRNLAGAFNRARSEYK